MEINADLGARFGFPSYLEPPIKSLAIQNTITYTTNYPNFM
jgi:hypothetical protein